MTNHVIEHMARVPQNAIARSRALLGEEAADLTDDDVSRITAHASALARVIVEAFLTSKPSGQDA